MSRAARPQAGGVELKPVDQTRFVPDKGNCFAACVASLLELNIDDVPNFVFLEPDWIKATQEWLAGRGLGMLALFTHEAGYFGNLYPLPAGLLCIIGGKSPRGDFGHAVVARAHAWKFDVIHDPHPSRAGLAGEPERVYFLIPLDPINRDTPEGGRKGQVMQRRTSRAIPSSRVRGSRGLPPDAQCASTRPAPANVNVPGEGQPRRALSGSHPGSGAERGRRS